MKHIATSYCFVSILLFAVLALANLQDGDDGKVSWDTNCDYPGNDIGRNTTLGNKCGKLCLDNPKCKYFAWSAGTCYLKDRHDNKEFFDGSVCGFVKDRVKNGTEEKIYWDTNCDYPGNDIGQNRSSANNCGRLCLDNSSCRYFAWSSGVCYLKSRHNSRKFFDGSVCGYIKDRIF